MGLEITLTRREADILSVLSRESARLPREGIQSFFYELQQTMLNLGRWPEPVFHFKNKPGPGQVPQMYSTLLDLTLDSLARKGYLMEDETRCLVSYCTIPQSQYKMSA